MQARYDDPVMGRFLSKDPVGFTEGGVGYFNRYAYVGGDPVNMTDPTGMASCGDLEGDSCNEALDAAHSAAEGYSQLASELTGIANVMGSGGELSEAQASMVGAFEQKFGEGSATVENLSHVAGVAQGVSDFIGVGGDAVLMAGDEKITRMTRTVPSGYYQGGDNIYLNASAFHSTGWLQSTIGHEATHKAGNTIDFHDRGWGPKISGYGQRGSSRIGSIGFTPYIFPLHNTDSYTCLVFPSDC